MPNLLLTMWDTIKNSNIGILVAAGLGMFAVIGGLSMLSYHYTLSDIKSRTVGDGQHGTARWATDKEIRQTYAHVPFKVKDWRKGVSLPAEQGLVLGRKGKKDELTALVDSDDIHCLMIAASGAGKTAFFLYPNLEYACASGMSFLALDTKGDLARNYGSIAKKHYGYKHISVIDLRNPTRSDGNNLLTLINRYMDIARKQPDNLAARAKAEKYAKILAKSIVSPEGNSDHGQNAFFYDAAEGLLSSTILLLAEFLPPDEEHPEERRHIVSVFKLVQDLLEPARGARGRSRFQLLMDKLPSEHKARWLAGAALNSSEQAMASVMSTVLSGSVSREKNDPSQSLQMMERPLLTADELKSIPKGNFIVQKTGCHPMRTRLRLFLEWGITFEEEYRVEEQVARKVYYADQDSLTRAIVRKYPPKMPEQQTTRSVKGEGQLHDAPVQEMVVVEDIDYDRMPHKRTPYNLPRQEVNR